jgi:HlyD family secretion protein
MRKKNRSLLFIILGIVVLVVVITIVAKIKGNNSALEVETAKVTRQTIIETIDASGKVQPEKEVKISADISGEIIELKVKEGDKVKQGDLLVRIKPDQYQSAVEKARAVVNNSKATLSNSRAAYTQAKASLEKAKLTYDRNKKLYDQRAISEADFQNIEQDYKVSQAQVEGGKDAVDGAQYNLESMEAALKDAEDNLIKTTIYSPIDGIISKLNVELGERVVGTAQMAGTEMMRVADLRNMEVQSEVNENDIVKLKLGDTTDIDIDAYRGRIFKGLVTEISNSAESSGLDVEKITNFVVKIRILESSYENLLGADKTIPTPFRPGMSANVTIHTKTSANVLAVPILAVTVRNDKGELDTSSYNKGNTVVFLYNNGTVKAQKVSIGIQDVTYIQITDGLQEGQEVVSGPYRIVSKQLKNGDKVEKSKHKS